MVSTNYIRLIVWFLFKFLNTRVNNMPTGIYPRTAEHNRKVSESKKGKKHPMWGKHHTAEAKRAISISLKGRVKSENTRQKLSEALKGKQLSVETKQKISSAHRGMKMLPFSIEHRRKIGEAKRGRNHPSWNGGSSFEPYSTDWTETLKESIRERDLYTCQVCGVVQADFDRAFDVHHIDYNKKNCNADNLITLCHKCHANTNFNRDSWTGYLQRGINV